MKRVVIVAVALIVVLTISGTAAVLVGQSSVVSTAPGVIDQCDGSPCFMGVIPGVTPLRTARKMIGRGQINLVGFKNNVTSVRFMDGSQVDVSSNGMGTVDAVYINPADGALSVAGVVSSLGPPSCGVQLGPPENQEIILFYPYAAVIVGLSADRLDMDARVVYMEILNPSHASNCDHVLAPGEPHTPWIGFASMVHYAENLPH